MTMTISNARAATQLRLNIPPGDPNYEVQGSFTFRRDSLLYEMNPHMHFRGSWAKFEALYPDGRREVLLSVPNYDTTGRRCTAWLNPNGCPPAPN